MELQMLYDRDVPECINRNDKYMTYKKMMTYKWKWQFQQTSLSTNKQKKKKTEYLARKLK